MPSFYRVIWLVPPAFALHIVEEYAGGFPRWVTNVVGGTMNPPFFLAANAFFMAVLLVLTLWSARTQAPRAAFLLMAWASANLFWDFLFHLITVPVFDRYSPGLVTATLLYLPVSILVAQTCLAEKVLTFAGFAGAVAIGIPLMGSIIWAGLYHFAI